MGSLQRGIIYLVVISLVIVGCSSGTDLLAPEQTDPVAPLERSSVSTHNLLGLFSFTIDPDICSVEITPLRDAELHLNALKFLEPPALVFLTVEGVPVINGNILDVDIGLLHPFLGQVQYSGLDICGIVFTHGSVSGFTDPDIIIAGDGDTRLLNADGYTRWWNPAEFPYGDTIFNYKDGLLGTPSSDADFNATVNGYKYFADGLELDDLLTDLAPSERGLFTAGMKNVRHYTIDMIGGLVFNYAVDANWMRPIGDPPFTIPDDFPPGANRPEAWNITVTELENSLYFEEPIDDAGGVLKIRINVWDHFDIDLNEISGESLSGLPIVSTSTPVSSGEGYSTYELTFNGENLTHSGDAGMLITVKCEKIGYGEILPGKSECSYFTNTFSILTENPYDPCDPDLDAPDTSIDSGCQDQPFGTTELILDVSGFDPNDCTLPENLTYDWRRALDGGDFDSWQPDPGPQITISDLTSGDWEIQVRAIDASSNVDPEPAQCMINIPAVDNCNPDLESPETFIDYGCEDQPQCTSTVPLGVSGQDPYNCTAPEDMRFEWRKAKNGGEFGGWSDPAYGPETYVTGLSYGDWLIEVRAVDLADNIDPTPSQCQFYIPETTDPSGWAASYGGIDWEWTRGVAIDSTRAIYITGSFEGTVDFDTSPYVQELTAVGNDDIYLAKYNECGNLIWVKSWGSEVNFQMIERGMGIAIDFNDNIFITGTIGPGMVDMDPGPGVSKYDTSAHSNAFISKFGSDGTFLWANSWGSVDFDSGHGVAVDSFGNSYVTGVFMNSADLDPGPGVDWHTSVGDDDAFLVKFDPDGNFQWAHSWGGEGKEDPSGVTVGPYDGILVTGKFEFTIDLDPTGEIDEYTSNGSRDAFLVKYDTYGNYVWGCAWGGLDCDCCNSVAVDGYGNPHVVGQFFGTVDFDPGPGMDEHTSTYAGTDVYLIKFDIDGNFQWARTWGGGFQHCTGTFSTWLTASKSGDVFVTGNFQDVMDFDPGPEEEQRFSAGMSDVFLSKFGPSGDFIWVRTWGGMDMDESKRVVLDEYGNIIITGNFQDVADLRPGPEEDEHTSMGYDDLFIVKLQPDGYW